MASEKIEKYSNYDALQCDLCGSSDIIQTNEGFTCRTCGIVLKEYILQYDHPYDRELIQHAVLRITQIGSFKERARNPESSKLRRLNKMQSIKSNKQTMETRAKMEISRIFDCLNLPETLKEMIFSKFRSFYEKLEPGTKYRSPEKLVPLTIYFCLKYRNISIKERELLEVSKISKEDFNAFKLQILRFFPQYQERDRKEYILTKILEVTEYFSLDMGFYHQSKKILYKLWDGIKNTKDDVVAGLTCSITSLCSYREITVNSICKRLGICMSTIQTQVKKRIFERFRVPGFISLVKSSDMLKRILVKLGLSEEAGDAINEDGVERIIEIKLGNIAQIFPEAEKAKYYFFAVRDNDNLPILLSLEIFDHLGVRDVMSSVRDFNNPILAKDLRLEVMNFHTGKGPPLVDTS